MNKFYIFLSAILLSAMYLTGQVSSQIGTGTSVPTNTLYAPMYRFSNSSTTDISRSNIVYTSAEMASAGIFSGSLVNKVAFYKVGNDSLLGAGTFGIWMNNSATQPPLSNTTTWASISSTFTSVFSDNSYVMHGDTGWIEFTLSAPFLYTGNSLEIAFEFNCNGIAGNPASGPFKWMYTPGFETYIQAGVSTTATPPATLNATVSSYKYRPNIQITYSPPGGLNAALSNIGAGATLCPGTYPVTLDLGNNGSDNVDSAIVNWSVNGVAQTPYFYSGTLLTGQSANLTLGNFTFVAGTSYDLVAYLTDVNGLGLDDSQTNDTTSVLGLTTGLVGTYSINSAVATGGANYQSFTDFANALNTKGVCGPVVVNAVAGSGPYTEQITFNEIVGASGTNTITINGNGDTLQFAPPSTAKYIMQLNGTDYMSINGLSIIGLDPTYGIGILLTNDALFDSIQNCTIDLSAITSTSSVNSAGIAASGSVTSPSTTGTTASSCFIGGNSIIGGTGGGPYYGIILNGNTGSLGCSTNTVYNNTITDCYYYGVYGNLTSNTLIDHNDISRPNRTTFTTFAGVYLTGLENPKTKITNNFIHNTHGGLLTSTSSAYAIYLNSDGVAGGQEILVANNVIYDMNGSGVNYGVYGVSVLNADIYHNSFSLDNTTSASASTTSGMYFTGTNDFINIYNNVISVTQTGTGAKYGLYTSAQQSFFKSDYNDIYVNSPTGTNYFGYNGTPQLTYADWIATSFLDSNSLDINPLFVDAVGGDLTPSAAALNNIGTDLSSVVSQDVLGTPRTSTPDPGAFEFAPLLDDAGVSQITTSLCPGTDSVYVKVVNYGISALTSVAVTATYNGTPLPNSGNVFTLNVASGGDTTLNIGAVTLVSGTVYDFVAYTNLPNNSSDGNHANDTTFSSVNLGLLGNFTINSAIVTGGGNFQSFTDAADALNNRGVCGPVVITVVPGSGPYNEQITINELVGASDMNTVTVKGNYETLTFLSTNTNVRSGILLNGADYITIDSLTIVAQGAASGEYGYGIHLTNQASFNQIVNNRIYSDTTQTLSNFAGIVVSGSLTSATTTGNTGNHNLIQNNSIEGGYYGITYTGASTSNRNAGNRILGNNVSKYYYYGIYVSNQDSMVIENNSIVERETGPTTGYGIYQSYNNFAKVNANKIVTSASSTNYGIYCTNCYGDAALPVLWSNNMVSCLGGTSTTYGIYPFNCLFLNVYHNSVNVTGGSATAGRGLYLNSSTTGAYGSLNVKNNIFTNTGLGYIVEITAAANTLGYVSSMNRNDLFGTGAVFGRFGTTNTVDLADWKATSALDTNSYSVDPGFTSPTDLHTGSNFLNDRGQAGLGVDADFDGDIRCPNGGCAGATLRPDIGADEFLGVPVLIDLGVTALNSPVQQSCYTNAETVSVTIKNFVATTIDFSADPATVYVDVTGPVNTSLSFPITSGTLMPDSTLTVNVSNAFDMSAAGLYNFNVYVSQSGDGNSLNDTLNFNLDFNVGDLANTYAEICSGSSFQLEIKNIAGPVQWQSYDATNSVWVNETGFGNDSLKYTVSPTTTTLYRTLTCGTYPSATDTIAVVSVSAPTVFNDTICVGELAMVSASGMGEMNWFTTSSSTSPIFTGDTLSYSTNTDTILWVEGSVTLLGGGKLLKITEVDLGSTDKIEIQNVGNQAINTTGWVVAISNSYTNINDVNSIYWNLPSSIAPGQTLFKTDATGPDYWGNNMFWNPGSPGYAMIIDGNGEVVDLIVWTWAQASLPTFSSTINGFPITFTNAWIGDGVNSTGLPAAQSLSRIGNSDNDNAADFANQNLSLNATNPNLSLPFVGGACTSSRVPVSIKVNPLPVVNLGADTTTCDASSITLDAGNAGSTYAWSTGETSQTIAVSSTLAPSVTVTDANMCSASADVSVVISSSPVVNLGADVAQCGGSVDLDAGNSGLSFAWSDGSSAQTLTATTSNEYAVTVTNTDNCAASDTAMVTINDLPAVNLGADVAQCGGSVTLDAGNAGSSYAWSSSETSQTVTLTASATAEVTVTDANSCSASDTVEVVIYDLPVVNLGADVAQCGGTVTLDAGNAGSNIMWSTAETTQTIIVDSTSTIDVMVTDANNCSAYDTIDVAINSFPVVDLGNDVTQCGGTVNLDAGNAGATFTWSNAETTQVVSVTTSGIYDVMVENAAGCSSSDTVSVTINPFPTVTLNVADTVCTNASPLTLTGGSPAGGTYSGTGVSAGVFTPSAAGVVTVSYVYTDSNSCTNSASDNIEVVVCVGIEDVASSVEFDIYPNPSNGLFNVSVTDFGAQQYDVKVFAADGRLTYSSALTSPISSIDLSEQAKGVYLIQVLSEGRSFLRRLVVE